jgi:membrane associated rhomboid family serine protease
MGNDLERSQGIGSLVKEFKNQIYTLSSLTAIAWSIQIVNVVILSESLTFWGIRPRNERGLFGIFFAPFLHGSFAHIAANTLPFLILGWLIMLQDMEDFVLVSLISALSSGIGVWLISPANSITVGASGVIFGYLGFILGRGYFERSFMAIVLAAVVMTMYGGVLFGILPNQPNISWQAHLFGFLGGLLAANWRSKKKAT